MDFSVILINAVTLIASKREVAARICRFSVERMSSYETGDKSLYQWFCFRQITRAKQRRLVTVAKQFLLGCFYRKAGNTRKRVQ